MDDLTNTLMQSMTTLCDYMYKFEQLELERMRINKDYEIMSRKISITEKVALEHIEFQKLVLEKSLAAATEDLSGLGASREIMIKAIERFSESIMAKKYSQAERECTFKIIALLSHELKQLRGESELKFKMISTNVIKALQNPFDNLKILKGGR